MTSRDEFGVRKSNGAAGRSRANPTVMPSAFNGTAGERARPAELQALSRFAQFFRHPDTGASAHGVLTARVVLSDSQYATPQKQVTYFEEVVRRIRQAPGVLAVSSANELPTSDELHGRGLRFPGRPEPKRYSMLRWTQSQMASTRALPFSTCPKLSHANSRSLSESQ